MNIKISATINSMNLSPVRLLFLLISFVLACFALPPRAQAICRKGCDNVTSSTFLGDNALYNNTEFGNTAIGSGALFGNTTGSDNTATGDSALDSNTTGDSNTANGAFALFLNTVGNENTATGDSALYSNTTGIQNTATGRDALFNNTGGSLNTATGSLALQNNTTGNSNTAAGVSALISNTTGTNNTALGAAAGVNLTTGSNNIDVGNAGTPADSGAIRIGTAGVQTKTFLAGISGATVPDGVGVIVGMNGKLGTIVSSQRFKNAVKPMDTASEAILALKPVTFRYKKELDPDGIPQFGLVAEDVEKVNSDLVARDEQGKPYTVRYEAVNAMLLNEFLKEHRKVQELEVNAAQQQRNFAEQQKQIEALTAGLQKVSAQLELSKSAPQTVLNNQ